MACWHIEVLVWQLLTSPYLTGLDWSPLGRSFNNIWSNIGYIALGFLGLIIVCRNKYMYMRWDARNGRERRRNRKGVPEYFGIYYALGRNIDSHIREMIKLYLYISVPFNI